MSENEEEIFRMDGRTITMIRTGHTSTMPTVRNAARTEGLAS